MNHQQLEGLLYWFPAFIMSTTVHEASHAWMALRTGDPTAYRGGQVSLSPWPHIQREPLGMLIVPLVTAMTNGWAMGWASAPYDPAWAAKYPRKAALMAAAGPAANLLLVAVAVLFIRAGIAGNLFEFGPPGGHEWSALVVAGGRYANGEWVPFLARAASVIATLNILLGVFNLLPVPPLDGSAVIDLFLPERFAGSLRRLGPAASMLGLFVAWRLFPVLVAPVTGVLEWLVGG